jgi:hypothetical protein
MAKTVSASYSNTCSLFIYVNGAHAAKNWKCKAHSHPLLIMIPHFPLDTGSGIPNIQTLKK